MKLWRNVTFAILVTLTALVAVSCGPKEPPAVPRVVRQTPLPSEELPVQSPLVVEFNQPMDPKSLEGQVRIEPAVPGRWAVQDRRLVFQPAAPLQPATVYRVVLGKGVKSSAGLTLADEVVLRFQTVGNLRVSQTQPADGAAEVERNIAITVIFNRPVVPLTDLKRARDLPQPLHLDPPVPGTGEWLNTSIYIFRPAEGLAGSTTYRATVPAGLQDTTGSVLAEDYSWTFTTESPKIVGTQPQGMKVEPTAQVIIAFNQPMDTASVEAGFSLRESETGNAVAGSFSWQGSTLYFKPAAPLRMGMGYVASVAAGVRSASGGTLAVGEERQFGVVPRPRVLRTSLDKDPTSVSPYDWVQIWFAGPMLLDTITSTLRVEPEGTAWEAYWNEYEDSLQLSVRLQPDTNYRITIPASAADPYGNTLGQDYVLAFHTRDLDPAVYFVGRWGDATVFNAYNEVKVRIAYRNIGRIGLRLYALSLDEFVRLNGNDWEYRSKFAPRPASLLRSWETVVSAPRNKAQTLDVPITADATRPLPPGVYYLVLSSPDIQDKAYAQQGMSLIVTRTNLVLKHGPKDALVWATDLMTGQPVESVPLKVYDGNGQMVMEGLTSAEGVWRGQFVKPRDVWSLLIVVGGSGETLAVAVSTWAAGIDPWEFSLPSESWLTPYVGYFYTDRPIYRPGQTVYFKGIIRADDDAHYSLPDIGPLRVTVSDPLGQQFYSQTLQVSDLGTVYSSLTLDENAPTGTYWLNAVPASAADASPYGYKEAPPSFGTTFQVAEYRKPEYEISVAANQPEYIQGDRIEVSVLAKYYFGAPVANAKVRWNVMAQPYFFQWQGQGWYDFHDWDYWTPEDTGSRVVASGEGTTDAEGRFSFTVLADLAKFTMSQTFSIEATVTDVNGQEVSGRTAVPVHKGEFYIGLSPKSYVGTAGKPVEVSVLTVNSKSQPAPNVPLTVIFSLRDWYSVQEKGADGGFYWTTRFKDTPVFTQTITTDGEGKALASFVPPEGGSYRVLALGRDARGNEVRSATYLWVSGAADEYVSWRMENNNRMELIADKKSYAPGETAHILIPSPFQGPVMALLTVERAGILSHRVLTLQSNSEQVDIPITEDLIPNAYVSVVLVKGKGATEPFASFRVGYVALQVSAAEKHLTIRVTPDRAGAYGPRETVQFAVETLDAAGRGVPAEVSLALVDASVLALAQRPGPDIMDFFYRKRGLGVQTAASLTLAIAEREAEPPAQGKGGGGAEGGLTARTYFPDTAYWEPALRTDSQGKAMVTVDLPDSLTTWRMIADGATANTQVGSSKSDIVVTKPLLVRVVAPRFFVIGDKPELAAIVHNNTDQNIQVQVQMDVRGEQSGFGRSESVEVPAKGLKKLTWSGTVGAGEQVTVSVRAAGGGLEDAIALTLPVYHFTTPEVVATAGEVPAGEQRVEIVPLPDVYEPSQGDLTVRVDPSLVAGMKEALGYLEHFPYECAEQTVSRFLPNVAAWRAYQRLGVRNDELEAKLPDLVAVGLQKLYAAQNMDGGWGWWYTEESHPYITAYVLLGLNEARRAGFGVDASVVERGTRFLKSQLDVSGVKDSTAANQQAFMLYVLGELGEGDTARSVALFEKRHLLSQYGKAFLATALQAAGDAHAGQVRTLVAELTGQAVLSATGAHWEETETDRYLMNTDVRSTAIVLRALVRIVPDNALLPNAVRWLMAARQDGRWATTQENAWALMALTDYAAMSGELEGEYRYQVGVNGKRVLAGEVRPENVDTPQVVRIPLKNLLKDVGNRIILERSPLASGQTEKGALYYSAALKYYVPVEQVSPLNRGAIVMREYTLADDPDREVATAKVGDIIRVKLTVIAPSALHYLVVEDPIPAGTEAVDTSLRTTSQLLEPPQFRREGENDVWGWWVFSHTEIRDEKVALFAREVPAGTYEYTYLLRASVPGQFLVMPAVAYEMYFPETFGRSAGAQFSVTP
ncbi:MAG: Ig-like domain-containing protein [Anaerolineae bacterium]|nr:Ig-like domain-containing protein [Anaerolineae bacterium]